MLASLTCTLFSCGPDELIPESVPPVVNPGDKDEPGGRTGGAGRA